MIQTWKVFVLPLFALASSVCPAQKPHVYHLSRDVAGTHDPSIMKEGKTWYVFATGKAPGAVSLQCAARTISNIGSYAVMSSTPYLLGFLSAARAQKICGPRISHMFITNTGCITPTHSSEKTPRVLL